MKVFVIVAVVFLVFTAAFASAESEEQQFRDFLTKFNKHYGTRAEYLHRLEVFRHNLAHAARLDARSEFSTYGVTKFMDLTPEEFRAKFLLKNMPKIDRTNAVVNTIGYPEDQFPASFDWSSKGVLTPVYNQEQCGSCWAFSATESIESMWALAGNTLASLSMQQIVDCDPYDDGCNGGNPSTAYRYVMEAGGLEAYSSYPYIGIGGPCRFDKSKIVAKISSWQWVTKTDNENEMQTFTNNTGPPSICVDASTWQYYQGGVITKDDGCGTSLDHCVQLTGWQQMKGMTVWNVRNSWGKDWGEKGYLYIQKGYDVCGIGQEVTSAIVH